MTENLLALGDYNVIRSNWFQATFTTYWQAATNARVVGLEIAYLVKTMIVCFAHSFIFLRRPKSKAKYESLTFF